jgi:hypothetical protein
MTKLALLVATLSLTAMPALAGSSQGGVARLNQLQSCYPGVACWPLGDDPPVRAYNPAGRGIPAPLYHRGECYHPGTVVINGRMFPTCY